MRSSARLATLDGWPNHVGVATMRISAATTRSRIAGHSSPARTASDTTPGGMSWSASRMISQVTPWSSSACTSTRASASVLDGSGDGLSVQLRTSARIGDMPRHAGPEALRSHYAEAAGRPGSARVPLDHQAGRGRRSADQPGVDLDHGRGQQPCEGVVGEPPRRIGAAASREGAADVRGVTAERGDRRGRLVFEDAPPGARPDARPRASRPRTARRLPRRRAGGPARGRASSAQPSWRRGRPVRPDRLGHLAEVAEELVGRGSTDEPVPVVLTVHRQVGPHDIDPRHVGVVDRVRQHAAATVRGSTSSRSGRRSVMERGSPRHPFPCPARPRVSNPVTPPPLRRGRIP